MEKHHIEHLHPEAQLYAHHAESLLAHAEATKERTPQVEKQA